MSVRNLMSLLPSKVSPILELLSFPLMKIKLPPTLTSTGAILVMTTLVSVTTMTTAAGHGLPPILTAGKDKPVTVVASMILFPTLLIMSLDSHAKQEAMASATLWNVQMSHIAVSL